MRSSEIIIKASGLTKNYDSFVAVDHIDFSVYKGEVCGFLGPNGAGKTTTIKMIHCVLPVTSGTLTVAGLSVNEKPREIKGMIGVAPQEENLDPDFTVLRNLLVYARYFDIQKEEAMKRADRLLDFFQLKEKKDVIISALSTGMKRRLILARALINKPQILLLDEPTTGLDPQARHLVWDEIRSLNKQGTSIILTTHYMDEAAELCHRTLVMDNGKIIEEGKPAELVEKHVGEEVLELEDDDQALAFIKEEITDARFETMGDRTRVYTNQPHGTFAALLRKHPIVGATIRNANLEDVFLKLTGRKLRE